MLVFNNVRANAHARSKEAIGINTPSYGARLPERDWIDMEILDWLIAGTSVFGLVVYCTGMTLLLGALAWANHLDHRRENQAIDARGCSAAGERNATQ